MKPIIAFFILLSSCVTTNAQYDVIPGAGIDKALLGMPVKDILAIIGEPSKVIGYEEERSDWQNFGYDVATTTVFSTSFDHVYIFNDAANVYAIWKIYTRNDTAVIFNQSSYQADRSYTGKITVNGSLRFYDDLPAIKKIFGDGFEKVIDEAKNTSIIYKEKGVFFIVNEDQLRNVFLFVPQVQQQVVVPSCPPGTWL